MTEEQFDRERRYCVAMAVVREMFDAGLLLPKELRLLETIFASKFLPVLARLLA